MLGAILGDMVGSPYEFDRNNIKTTEFPLFSDRSEFTDDTVMTLAVAEGLMNSWGGSAEKQEKAVIAAMRRFGRMYPDAGYGARFGHWIKAKEPRPYDSFGNGSAMRVSAAAYLYDNLSEVEECAALTARVTHNHPEGIKGAQATAAAIFLARTAGSKSVIGEYIARTYGYDLQRTLAEIRLNYHHVESAQETVPEAIIAFLASSDFENALRLAVSLGGDSDTLAAITGSIAEGFYGVPQALRQEALARLDAPLVGVWRRWEDFLARR